MRTLAITQNITLDGAVEMLGDWFDPQGGEDSEDLAELTQRDSDASDAFLVGRQTFEDMRSFWPHQVDDTTGVTDHLNRVAKYVVSSTLEDPGWEGTTILGADFLARIAALKDEPGKDIVVTGSIRLCHALIEAGLVDQFRFFTYPVVQGRGRRLFPEGTEIPALRLLETRALRSGVTYARYAVS